MIKAAVVANMNIHIFAYGQYYLFCQRKSRCWTWYKYRRN